MTLKRNAIGGRNLLFCLIDEGKITTVSKSVFVKDRFESYTNQSVEHSLNHLQQFGNCLTETKMSAKM